MLLAHGLFKAPLFLVTGIVDHATGTRDVRKLSGLRRRARHCAVDRRAAAASMAGLPPLLGFVGKEAAFEAFARPGGSPRLAVTLPGWSRARCSPSPTARGSCGARSAASPAWTPAPVHRPGGC